MEEQLISVIIPVYNVKPYLRQCLESIIRQTHKNLDILIVDDGSTDGSGEICEEYAKRDKRIRVFHTENKGLSHARNLGLDHAAGEFIAFLDSDDWASEDMLQRMLQAMLENQADLVTCQFSREAVNRTIHPSAPGEFQILRGEEILRAFAYNRINNNVWNKLYRAELFSQIRFPIGRNYEDVATTYKIIRPLSECNGTVVRIPDELVHYRLRTGSISKTWTAKNILDRWTSYREKMEAMFPFHEQFLSESFLVIGSLWVKYAGFPADVRRQTAAVFQDMQDFSKKHFRIVLTGKFSLRSKVICFCALSRNPIQMWILYKANQVRSFLPRNQFRPMYDKMYP